ncbi:MAG: SelB C-terminal domain-containing protein, partial [Luteibacter sp.]
AWSEADPRVSFAGLLDTPPYARDVVAFARDRALSPAAVARVIDGLSPLVFDAGGAQVALSPTHWRRGIDAMAKHLAVFHAEHPDLQGMPRETLRRAVQPRLPATAFAQALLHPELAARIVRDGAFVRLIDHVPQASPEDAAAWMTIAPLLGGTERFRPPRVRDIASSLRRPEGDIRRRLKSAARRGLVDEVAHDHFFLREVVDEMLRIAADIAAHAPDGRFTAAQFRDRLDNGRKVAIQILEFFDRQGVMLNRGTLRSIRADYLDLFAAPSP